MYRILGLSSSVVIVRSSRRRRASSLVELLVVVSIIAILFSMLIPSLKRSMRLAASTVCAHNLRQVGISLMQYRVENDGWLPVVTAPQESQIAGADVDVWFLKLFPTYLHDPAVLSCPEDPFRSRMLRASRSLDRDEAAMANYASYGINGFIMTGGGGLLADVDRYGPSRPLNTMLVADLGPDYPTGTAQLNRARTSLRRNNSLLKMDDGIDIFQGTSDPWLTVRHNEGINVLTLNGDVRSARTVDAMRRPLSDWYADCAAGGCTLCRELQLYHYSFAQDRLFWFTGPAPEPFVPRFGS